MGVNIMPLFKLSVPGQLFYLDKVAWAAGQRTYFHGFLPLPSSKVIVTKQFLPFTWIWQKTIPALNRRQLHIPATVSSNNHETKAIINYWIHLLIILFFPEVQFC
jgi:hypothetical protein